MRTQEIQVSLSNTLGSWDLPICLLQISILLSSSRISLSSLLGVEMKCFISGLFIPNFLSFPFPIFYIFFGKILASPVCVIETPKLSQLIPFLSSSYITHQEDSARLWRLHLFNSCLRIRCPHYAGVLATSLNFSDSI